MDTFDEISRPHPMANGSAHSAPMTTTTFPVPSDAFLPPLMSRTQPAWYRNPADHTPEERAYVASWTKRVLHSEEAAERVRRAAREILHQAQTRQEATDMLATRLGVAPVTAAGYLLGLRLTTPLRDVRPKKRRNRTAMAGRQGLGKQGTKPVRGPIDQLATPGTVPLGGKPGTTPWGKQGNKPASQLRAERATAPTMISDLAGMESMVRAFRSLSQPAQALILAHLNQEAAQ